MKILENTGVHVIFQLLFKKISKENRCKKIAKGGGFPNVPLCRKFCRKFRENFMITKFHQNPNTRANGYLYD